MFGLNWLFGGECIKRQTNNFFMSLTSVSDEKLEEMYNERKAMLDKGESTYGSIIAVELEIGARRFNKVMEEQLGKEKAREIMIKRNSQIFNEGRF